MEFQSKRLVEIFFCARLFTLDFSVLNSSSLRRCLLLFYYLLVEQNNYIVLESNITPSVSNNDNVHGEYTYIISLIVSIESRREKQRITYTIHAHHGTRKIFARFFVFVSCPQICYYNQIK